MSTSFLGRWSEIHKDSYKRCIFIYILKIVCQLFFYFSLIQLICNYYDIIAKTPYFYLAIFTIFYIIINIFAIFNGIRKDIKDANDGPSWG